MTPQPGQSPNKYSFSKGFAAWLSLSKATLCFSSYDGGSVTCVGTRAGNISITTEKFGRAMGLCTDGFDLWIATNNQILRLRNQLEFGQEMHAHDAVYVPNAAHFVGACDTHELFVSDNLAFLGTKDAREIHFVNTRYSCIAKPSHKINFVKTWAPDFITACVPEDRCHLNGACADGYVTLVGKSDGLEGWRQHRQNGGMVMHGKAMIYDNLSMPHSPRVYKNQLYFLDSGRGWFRKGVECHTFLNGFARGLSFIDDYALVTISLPREGVFNGLELQREISIRNAESWCGILVIDLKHGGVIEWLRIEGATRELFDCVVLPYSNALIVAPGNPLLAQLTKWE